MTYDHSGEEPNLRIRSIYGVHFFLGGVRSNMAEGRMKCRVAFNASVWLFLLKLPIARLLHMWEPDPPAAVALHSKEKEARKGSEPPSMTS
jgi:hypothetical protein